jgi:hypothetical protein
MSSNFNHDFGISIKNLTNDIKSLITSILIKYQFDSLTAINQLDSNSLIHISSSLSEINMTYVEYFALIYLTLCFDGMYNDVNYSKYLDDIKSILFTQ